MMIPAEYGLDQNYPNPFNSTTVIRYRLPEESRVSVRIYDVLGREIVALVDRVEQAGEHSTFWNAGGIQNQVPVSGVYYCRIQTASVASPGSTWSEIRKILLVK
jgi:hypothetical protein